MKLSPAQRRMLSDVAAEPGKTSQVRLRKTGTILAELGLIVRDSTKPGHPMHITDAGLEVLDATPAPGWRRTTTGAGQ